MSFGILALVCAVALAGPFLSVWKVLRIPVVVGELAVGLLLGRTGLGVLQGEDSTFSFLAEVGFALVMVVAGSHVPVRDPALRQHLRVGLLRAVVVGALAAAAGVALGTAFGTGHGALYAVLLASSSAALILPVVQAAGARGPAVLAMLPQVAVADAAAIVLLPMAVDPPHTVRAIEGALAVTGAALVVYHLLAWLERSGRRRAIHHLSEEGRLAIELRASLALTFALAALAHAARVSVMLAGFAFGLALAAIGEPRRLAKQLFALTEGFFAPLFFVWLGSSLDLRNLVEHPSAIALGVALGLAAVAVHLGGGLLTRQPTVLGVLTAAQLGVPVAAVTVGSGLGVLGPGEPAALLLGALITVGATSLAGRRVAVPATEG